MSDHLPLAKETSTEYYSKANKIVNVYEAHHMNLSQVDKELFIKQYQKAACLALLWAHIAYIFEEQRRKENGW